MSIGKALANAREGKYTQEELSFELPVSREAISKYETENRKVPDDLMPQFSRKLDDPFLNMALEFQATGGSSIPFLNGDYIDRHPAAMKDLVQRETNEALEHLANACMIKPIHLRTDQEKQEMLQVVMELLDSQASMKNLVAVICKEYKFSMKEIFETWRVTLKARKWKK